MENILHTAAIPAVKPARKRGLRYVFNLFLVGFIALMIGMNVIVPVHIANVLVHKREALCCYTPADWGLDYKDVSLTTTDGLQLEGWYIPSHNGAAVIAVHGSNSNRTGTLAHAVMLAEHGYGVLLFDLRGHGNSDGDYFTWGWDANLDMDAAVAYLQTRDDIQPERIGALGLSMGAEVVLQGAAYNEQIRAVVSDGVGLRTFTDFLAIDAPNKWPQTLFLWSQFTAHGLFAHVTPPPALTELVPQIAPRPVLLIYGGKGNPVEGYWATQLAATTEKADLWGIPEASHIGGIVARPEAYSQRVITFFDQALLKLS